MSILKRFWRFITAPFTRPLKLDLIKAIEPGEPIIEPELERLKRFRKIEAYSPEELSAELQRKALAPHFTPAAPDPARSRRRGIDPIPQAKRAAAPTGHVPVGRPEQTPETSVPVLAASLSSLESDAAIVPPQKHPYAVEKPEVLELTVPPKYYRDELCRDFSSVGESSSGSSSYDSGSSSYDSDSSSYDSGSSDSGSGCGGDAS